MRKWETVGVQSCTFKETTYADGSGDGAAIYGVTTDYQAKAACHAQVAIGPQRRTAKSKAVAGDTIIWGGTGSYSGRVKVPWTVRGTLTTQTQSAGILGQTKADASVVVTLGLWDQTDNVRDTEVVIDVSTTGQSAKNVNESSRANGKKDQFTATYVPGHKYTAFIQVEVSVKAEGQLKAPVLGADALADFFSDGFGAKLEFVEWEFDMPDGVKLLCNVNQA